MNRLILFLSLFCWVSPLFARDASFNAQNLKPASDVGNYFGVLGSQTLHQGNFSLGLTTDYAQEPIILVNAAGAKIRNIVGREIGTYLTGSFGLMEWWDVGLLVATAPYINFFTSATASQTRIRMGDVQLSTRLRLLDNQTYPVGVAVVPILAIPTGNGASLVGNNRVTGGGMVVVETKRIADRFSVALNAGYEVRPAAVLSTGTTMNDLVLYGLGGNFSLLPRLDLIAEARGFTLANDLFGSTQRPIEYEGGVRFYPASRWAVSVGGGSSLLDGVGNPLFRVLAGVAYVPEHQGFVRKEKTKIVDSDGDGISDDLDRCPTEVGTEDNGGCPEAPKLVITPEEYRIMTRPIYFDFEKATLRPDALPILQALVDALKVKPMIKKLSIEGHCDEIGTDVFNQWLSEERAKTVQDYLLKQGVEASRLETVGYGKKRPIDPGHNHEAWQKNRRVEFIFKEVEGISIPEIVPQSPSPTLPETGPVSVPPVAPEVLPTTPEATPMPPVAPSKNP